jgi:molybdopterin/thiamine biosynthesis adenylyltransferase
MTHATRAKRVVVIGAGGNIGSHLVPHLARMGIVGSVTLIDRDRYEARNLTAQDAGLRDVGRSKARVQARRLHHVNPTLHVDAIADSVENLPLGSLRGDVILTCLDSRVSRQYVNQAACRLGVPWIDAGVLGDQWLARIDVYLPGGEAACLECPWSEGDYEAAALERGYPCAGGAGSLAPTRAASSLGALAASLQAIECGKLLNGAREQSLIGRQLVMDAGNHRQHLTALRRNPGCRMPDHEPWRIRRLGAEALQLTIADAFDLAGEVAAPRDALSLSVAGRAFSRALRCRRCGQRRAVLRLQRGHHSSTPPCPHCGEALHATGFDSLDALLLAELPRRALRRSLRSLGLRPHEVFTVRGRSWEAHFEIGEELWSAESAEP